MKTRKTRALPVSAALLFHAALGFAVIVCGCASGASAQKDAFDTVKQSEWILSEVRTEASTIAITQKDVFTLKFEDERLSGKGSPNLYFSPYKVDGHTITIGLLAGTLMAGLPGAAGFSEADYFQYLPAATRWDIKRGKLEISATTADKKNVVLVYTKK